MTQRHELRWGGYAGFAFIVFAVVAELLPGLPPKVTDPPNEIVSYVSDAKGQLLTSALLWAAAAALLIWFIAAFAEATRERGERSYVHMALLAGAVFLGGAIFVTAAGTAALAYGIDTRAGVVLAASRFESLMVLSAMIGIAAALPLAAAGVGVLRTHMMPNWLGWVGIAAAIISVASAFAIYVTSGTYAPGGDVMPLVSLVAGGIFVICASVFMVREHLPEVAPMTPGTAPAG